MLDAMKEYGRADFIQQQLGLSASIGPKLAAIITFAGSIEYYLERALWRLRRIDPKGVKPETDARVITDLISMLERFAADLAPGDEKTLLEGWCKSARDGFTIRHNIAHGVALPRGGTLVYARNPRWHGEIRKREFGDFWADEPTLDLVREAMAVLLRLAIQLSREEILLKEIANPLALKALRTARSVLGEFASQDYNPSFEKY
ncbi:hypothetical protein LUG20_39195 [Bradyrhizobium japonicum]|jgi:hypothetical protein|uniref:hypothetical protein n=2 Tax=Nitrobacteraceae TaxID=41294 RepID=UPI002B243E3B|nr:hypothetical protein [Bradyrhizobium japonicum]MCD9824044.1 hypothetical protein [Bradyrhizobium japonicum]MEB2671091.1 hypothetical protein [Bradyrhizobium japonicum]WRI90414.1 hypothetical protein R3F75_05495 [Bradyrhizobium japonicum]WRJ93548.1 hypothetical protein R3F77_04305 [Bradyrhizobium japonicum]